MPLEMADPIAAPIVPKAGMGPNPRMRTTFKTTFISNLKNLFFGSCKRFMFLLVLFPLTKNERYKTCYKNNWKN